jgi:hypothetical protein
MSEDKDEVEAMVETIIATYSKGAILAADAHLKLAEISRELAMRRIIYPKMIAQDILNKRIAESRIKIMAAIAEDYERIIEDYETGVDENSTKA